MGLDIMAFSAKEQVSVWLMVASLDQRHMLVAGGSSECHQFGARGNLKLLLLSVKVHVYTYVYIAIYVHIYVQLFLNCKTHTWCKQCVREARNSRT